MSHDISEEVIVPREIFLLIFSFMQPNDLAHQVPLVAREWLLYSSMNEVWRKHYERQFKCDNASRLIEQVVPSVDEETIWKTRFAYKYQLERAWYSRNEGDHLICYDPDAGDDAIFYGYNCLKMHRSGFRSEQLNMFTALHTNIYHYVVDLDQVVEERRVPLQVKNVFSNKTSSFICWSIDYHPERFGNRLISSGSTDYVALWNAETSEQITTLKGHTSPGIWNAKIMGSNTIVSSASDNTAKIFDVNAGIPILSLKHTSVVYDVDVPKDGLETDLLVTGTGDKSVNVFDQRTGSDPIMKTTNLSSGIYEVFGQMVASNTILAGTDRGEVIIIDTRKMSDSDSSQPAVVSHFPVFSGYAVRGISYDGSRLIVGSKRAAVICTNDPNVETPDNAEFFKELDNNSVNIIDQRMMQNPPYHVVKMLRGDSEYLCLSNDEELLVAGGVGSISLYDFRPRKHGRVTSRLTTPILPDRHPTSTCNLQ